MAAGRHLTTAFQTRDKKIPGRREAPGDFQNLKKQSLLEAAYFASSFFSSAGFSFFLPFFLGAFSVFAASPPAGSSARATVAPIVVNANAAMRPSRIFF